MFRSLRHKTEDNNLLYDFVNKGQSAMLAINVPDGMKVGETTGALSVGESYGGWAFSSVYKESLERNQTLYTYQEADNVLILLAEGDGIKAKKIKQMRLRIIKTH